MKNLNFLFKFSSALFGIFIFFILSSNTAFADVSQLDGSSVSYVTFQDVTQTLGIGLTGTLGAVSIKVEPTSNFNSPSFRLFEDNTVVLSLSCTIENWNSGTKILTFTAANCSGLSYIFNPTKQYSFNVHMGGGDSAYWYGSSNPTSYPNGAVDNTIIPVVDLYFTITETYLEPPVQNINNAIYDTASDVSGNNYVGQTFSQAITSFADKLWIAAGEKSNTICSGTAYVRVDLYETSDVNLANPDGPQVAIAFAQDPTKSDLGWNFTSLSASLPVGINEMRSLQLCSMVDYYASNCKTRPSGLSVLDSTKYYYLAVALGCSISGFEHGLFGYANSNPYVGGSMKGDAGGSFAYNRPTDDLTFSVNSGMSLSPEIEIVNLNQFKADGVTEVIEGGNVLGTAMTFKANVSSSANNQVKLQVELRRLDEFNGEFLDTSTQESAFVDSGTEATVSAFDLANGAYHWQARAIDSQGNASAWQEFGEVGNIDFIVIDPVIIVPGIGGSVFDPISGFKVIDPIFGTYDNLIEALEYKGYVSDETLFPFPYNWMQDNARTAEDLQDKIADIKNICDCQKVDVIAHSMGGLVTRYYIQNDLYQYDIDQFIILGTPHLGAPEIYLLWEGGELQPNFENFLMKLLLDDIADITGYAGAVSFIRNGPIESIEQLLGVYTDYLKLADSGTFLHYPEGYPRNVFLEELNSQSGLVNLGGRGVRIYNLAGENGDNNTINSIRIVDDPSRWPLWLDGYPENFDDFFDDYDLREIFDDFFGDHGLERGEGDKSVPLYSAQYLNASGVEQIQIVSDHRDLPSRAFNRAYEILTGIPTDPIEPTHPVLRFLRIAVLSPVDIQVVDPLGRIVGTDFLNNQIINEISGAYYTGSETTFLEYMTIPNPVDGEYRIVTRGNDSGSYKIKVDIFSEEELTEETFVANTQSGIVEDLNFSLNTEDLELSEIEPEDTKPPVISSTALVPEYYLNSTPLQFDYSAQDEDVGLFSVSATLDGQNFESGQIVNFTTPGTHIIVITAKDLVNNIFTKTISFDIVYQFDGFLNPIKTDGSGIYKLSRTLPVKFQLFDINEQFIPGAVVYLTAAKIQNGIVGTDEVPFSSSSADVGNLFRVENGYYVYNLATSSLDDGIWRLKVTLDDARVYTVIISLY